MAAKRTTRKPSTRKRDYDTVAGEPGASEKLGKLADWLSDKSGGFFCSRSKALTIALDEALSKRGIK